MKGVDWGKHPALRAFLDGAGYALAKEGLKIAAKEGIVRTIGKGTFELATTRHLRFPLQLLKRHNLAEAAKLLQKSNIGFHWNFHKGRVIVYNTNLLQEKGAIELLKGHQIPVLSKTLKSYTGMDFRFTKGVVTLREARKLGRAAEAALRDPALRSYKDLARVLPSMAPPLKIQLRVPLTIPKPSHILTGFRLSTGMGVIAGLNEYLAFKGITGAYDFLRGRNPGWVAGAVFANPLTGLVVGAVINRLWRRKRLRRMQRELDRRRKDARRQLDVATEEWKTQVKAYESGQKLVRRRRRRTISSVARAALAMRYGAIDV